MSRLPGTPAMPAKRAAPDVYTVLLLVAILLLIAGIVCVHWNLTTNYGLTFGQLFKSVDPPK